MSCFVFDLGGTLFEFVGMPYSWSDYYKKALITAVETLSIPCSEQEIELSDKILKEYNPRINYREKEIKPEEIFEIATKHWKYKPSVQKFIEAFFIGMDLNVVIYRDVFSGLNEIKRRRDKIAYFTDLPSGMPDYMMRKSVSLLLPYADIYMSSQECGYRKPNPEGIIQISDRLNVDMEEIIYVGDEEKDFETAKRAGCKFIFLSRKKSGKGYKSVQDILDQVYKREL